MDSQKAIAGSVVFAALLPVFWYPGQFIFIILLAIVLYHYFMHTSSQEKHPTSEESTCPLFDVWKSDGPRNSVLSSVDLPPFTTILPLTLPSKTTENSPSFYNSYSVTTTSFHSSVPRRSPTPECDSPSPIQVSHSTTPDLSPYAGDPPDYFVNSLPEYEEEVGRYVSEPSDYYSGSQEKMDISVSGSGDSYCTEGLFRSDSNESMEDVRFAGKVRQRYGWRPPEGPTNTTGEGYVDAPPIPPLPDMMASNGSPSPPPRPPSPDLPYLPIFAFRPLRRPPSSSSSSDEESGCRRKKPVTYRSSPTGVEEDEVGRTSSDEASSSRGEVEICSTSTPYRVDDDDVRHSGYSSTTTTVTRRVVSGSESPKVVTTTTTVRRSTGRPDEEKDSSKKKFESPSTAFPRITRGGSVKALSQKFQQAAAEAEKNSSSYPKAGLIFRTASFRQTSSPPTTLNTPVHSPSAPCIPSTANVNGHAGTTVEEVVERRSSTRGSQKDDSDYSQQIRRRSVERASPSSSRRSSEVTTVSRQPIVDEFDEVHGESLSSEQRNGQSRSFLGNQTKVTGVQDVLSRMREADNEGPAEGDTVEDSEARALLNKFLGAQVILQGMEPLIHAQSPTLVRQVEKQRVQKETTTVVYSPDIDLDGIWDERRLRQLLESCSDYDGRRKIRARILTVMAEQKVTAEIVAEGRLEAEESARSKAILPKQSDDRQMESSTTVLRSVQGHSEATSMSSSTDSSVTKTEVHTKTSNYSATVTGKSRVSKAPPPKTMSPFAKFKQLDEQNAGSLPNSPKSPGGTGPLFKFTDPQLSRSASGVKDKLLYWCQVKTKEYKNIQIENFSTSWSNGLAFCALIHHFCPDAFDYDTLRPEERRKNFDLAFRVADEKAGIAPLLDVEDMVTMRKPDWKCVFTYVQSIYRRFKDED